MSRVTILDVAAAAGVRPSTVSKALNDGRGSPEVRRRVEAAVAHLGYRPNERARGLRRSESHALGVLIPDLANPAFLPLLRGVEGAAQERGYVVLIADGQRSETAETAAVERFFDQGVDGLLLGGAVSPESLRLFVDHGVPIAPSLSDDDRNLARRWERGEAAATRTVALHLLQLGHRRFAFVATPQPKGLPGRRYRRGRLGALVAVLDESGAGLTVVQIDPTRGFDDGQRALQRTIGNDAPTAFICGSHLLAPWLLLALDATRRRIPRDVSVVVHGDSDWARAFRPALSVIRRDTYAEGFALATSLIDAIAHVDTPRRTVPSAEFVDRGSIAAAPGR